MGEIGLFIPWVLRYSPGMYLRLCALLVTLDAAACTGPTCVIPPPPPGGSQLLVGSASIEGAHLITGQPATLATCHAVGCTAVARDPAERPIILSQLGPGCQLQRSTALSYHPGGWLKQVTVTTTQHTSPKQVYTRVTGAGFSERAGRPGQTENLIITTTLDQQGRALSKERTVGGKPSAAVHYQYGPQGLAAKEVYGHNGVVVSRASFARGPDGCTEEARDATGKHVLYRRPCKETPDEQ